MKLQLRKVGNSVGLILPKELLARLGLRQGDEVVLTERPHGFSVDKGEADTTFEEGLKVARQAMRTYHNALKELAK